MSRLKLRLLAATIVTGLAGGVALAQQSPTYDPAQLPETHGKVAQYTLTPRGDVDGLILDDGTEVHVPPHVSTQLVYSVRPGDAVTIHGLKAKALPMVMAMSVTNDATHATVLVAGPHEEAAKLEDTGTVKAALHGPRGELNGVLLTDGTVVRLPPPEAAKLGDQLAAGKTLLVRGDGRQGPLGRVIAAREIGADANSLVRIAAAPPPWMHGMMHGKHHGEPGPHGDDAPPPAP